MDTTEYRFPVPQCSLCHRCSDIQRRERKEERRTIKESKGTKQKDWNRERKTRKKEQKEISVLSRYCVIYCLLDFQFVNANSFDAVLEIAENRRVRRPRHSNIKLNRNLSNRSRVMRRHIETHFFRNYIKNSKTCGIKV
jgi:hypothetical protein